MDTTNLFDGYTGLTLEAWFYQTASGGYIATDHYACGNWESVLLSPTQFIINSSNSSATRQTLSFSEPSLNKWHHIAAVWTGSQMKVYLDGKLYSGPISAPNAPWNASSNFTIGAVKQASVDCWGAGTGSIAGEFKGKIDEVKIYPYARSAEQIKADYLAGLAGVGAAKGSSAVLGSSNLRGSALSDGLVAYYKFDESSWTNDCTTATVTDASGNGNNGKACPASTGPTGGAAGKFGSGGSFDGSDDYVEVPSSNSLNSYDTTNELTIAFWVYRTSTSTVQDVISKRTAGNVGGFVFETASGSTNVYHFVYMNSPSGSNNGNWPRVNASYDLNKWTHIVVTYSDETGLRAYKNGQLADFLNVKGDLNPVNAVLRIGKDSENTNAKYFAGKIDEVRIYNRALSPREVRALYEWAPGPVVYYDFNEKTGTTVTDKSGNDITGSFIGSPSWVQGKFGGGLELSGSGQYVGTSNNSLLNNTKAFTVEAWINPDSLGQKMILGNTVNNFVFDLRNGISLYVRDASGWGTSAQSGAGTIVTGEWQHVAGVFDGSTIKVYINGVLKATTSRPTTLVSGDFGLKIGTYGAGGGWLYDGRIDEVRFYNYARTQKQIIEDMNAGHPVGGSPVGSQVLYLKFDEGYGSTAHDSSPQGNDGTLQPSTGGSNTTAAQMWTSDGKVGKAVEFDGTDDYVDIGDKDSLDFGTGDFTITAWVKTSNTQWQYIYSKGTGSTDAGGVGYGVAIYSNGMYAYIHDGTRLVTPVVGSGIADGNWHHLVWVFDRDGNMTPYIDGVAQTPTDISSRSGSVSNSINAYVGFIGGTLNRYFDGLIDDLKIYNVALTADEVKQEYNQGKAMVMGAVSTDSSGNPSWSSSREYCIPGDTATCAPPVLELKFDEKTGTTAYDTSGNGNNGTISGATWKGSAECKSGACLSFDGSNDYVNVNDSSTLDVTSGVTVEAWVKISDQTPTFRIITEKDVSGQYSLFVMSDGLKARFRLNSLWATSTTTITDGRWHHIAGTATASTVRIYVDGKLEEEVTGTDAFTTNNTPVTIGIRNGGTLPFKGEIDLVRIYNYARTPAQIAWDYNRGKPVGWWKFDECQGTTLNDASGNANNGTLNIGASGTQTSAGTCTDGLSTSAWYNGSTGKYNASLNFDGTDDYVSVGNPSELSFERTNPFTLGAWIKTNSTTGRPIGKLDSSTNGYRGYSLFIRNGKPVLQIISTWTSNAIDVEGNTTVADGAWHHIVATYDGSSSANGVKIYVDGKQISTTTNYNSLTGTIVNNINLEIGRGGSGSVLNPFNGQIDDVRIYNYALTEEQVKNLYNEGSAVRFGPSQGSP